MARAVCTVRRICTAFFGIVVLLISLAIAPNTYAITSEYQQCPVNSSCTIGEFLYQDDGTPLTGAACTYTARKPDGTVFLNAVSMTGQSDAWYAYDVNTTSAVLGLYRGNVCCTPPGETAVCIERSFEVAEDTALSATDVENAVWNATRADHTTTGTFGENLQNPSSISASDIWSYPSRSLTSFGDLVGDIWGSSTRELSGFGDLVSSIWSRDSRSLTTNSLGDNKYIMTTNSSSAVSSTTNNTTINNITYNTLTQQLSETKTLLEKLINEPTIETFISDAPSDDLNSKLQRTEQTLLSLQEHVARASNATDLALLTWTSVDADKIVDGLDTTIQLLGKDVENARPETILDETQRVSELWDSYQLASTVDQTKAALVSAIKTRNEVKIDGKNPSTRRQLEETAKFVAMLQTVVGTENDAYTKATAFGYLRDMQRKAEALKQQRQSINTILSDWDANNDDQRDQLLASVSKELTALNTVPSAQLITTPMKEAETTTIRQKNTAYGLRALIGANEQLLAKSPKGLVNLVWFEEGSVVYRFLATNPSKTTAQDVKIMYQLPYEIGKDDILEHDPELTILYNPETSGYVLNGTITLNPSESRSFSIEVNDVWKIPQAEIESLTKRADTLYDSLKRTQYAAQATETKKAIDDSLAQIAANTDESASPDVRIRAYRQNQLAIVEIKQSIASMELLTASSSAKNTVFGFVGGIQVVILWGMIIVLMAGFIYLALYTHAIRFKFKSTKNMPKSKGDSKPRIPIWKRVSFALFLATIVTTTTASVGSAMLAKQGMDKARSLAANEYPTVLGTSITEPKRSLLTGKEHPVNVYAAPDENAQMYHKIPEDIYVLTKTKSKEWVQIQYTWGGLVYIGWVKDIQIQPLDN